jgi:transposase-like protein
VEVNRGMTKQRRRHNAQFKFQVALDAAREKKTIAQLAAEHGVHPNQISQWKKQLLDEGSGIFSKANGDQQKRQESVQTDLYEQIGRLKMELEWLKKKVP